MRGSRGTNVLAGSRSKWNECDEEPGREEEAAGQTVGMRFDFGEVLLLLKWRYSRGF